MPFGATHSTLRALASYATQSFFSRVLVENEEEVPGEGTPTLVCANHWNSAVDPAILSCYFPKARKLHYWAKSTLFKPGLARTVLLDAGNIPVDRKTKDNQALFASSFDMLKYGEAIAIFPEGGSTTIPGLVNFKDGASWAALEYATNIRRNGRKLSTGGAVAKDPTDVVIVVAGISYTDKTKYRSCAVMKFAPCIKVEPYFAEFETDPKSAVKKLTRAIEESMRSVTVNAKDFESLDSAIMARKMLWVDESNIPLAKLRDIEQTLVDYFAQAETNSSIKDLRTLLLAYRASLRATKLTHYTLSGVPLPDTLDPSIPNPLPTRFRVALALFGSTIASLIRLPFFILPLIVHLPIYLIAKYSLRFSDLQEDYAQNKIALGLILALMVYPTLFFVGWMLFFFTPFGALLAGGSVWAFVVYHNTIIDDNYNTAKKFLASWRVLVGIWAPHAKSEAVAALQRFGVQEDIAGENAIRRVLRLRLEASKALADHLLNVESESEQGKDMVGKLVEWGGKIKRPKSGATLATTKLD